MHQMKLHEEFKSLIDESVKEAPLQSFLEMHPDIIVNTFCQGAYYPVVFPQFHLADEFKPDFVMIGHRSLASWDVDLIEIKPAVSNKKLFNSKHQPTGNLRIAEGQVDQLQMWIERKGNREFFVQRTIDKILEEHAWDKSFRFDTATRNDVDIMVWYRIVIGRRGDFEGWGDQYRTNKWRSSNNRVEIVPWDRLLEKAKQIEKRVS